MIQSFQRDEPQDVDEVRAQVERDAEALPSMSAPIDAHRRVRLLGRVGAGLRLLGRFDESARSLGEAVELARHLGDTELEIANLIRLATSVQYAGRHDEARVMLDAVLRRCASGQAPGYEDFALQHLGKLLVEQGKVGEAIPLFERALTLRRRKGDGQLVASTARALAGARARLEGP